MFKKMMNIWLNVWVLTQGISLVIEIWHQSSYNSKSEIRYLLRHHPCQHCRCTGLPIRSRDRDRSKSFRNFCNELIISETDMIMFFSRRLLINSRLSNLRTINNSLNIWIYYKIVKIYLIVSVSDNNFQSMVFETIRQISLDIIDTDNIFITDIIEHHGKPRHSCPTSTYQDDIIHIIVKWSEILRL